MVSAMHHKRLNHKVADAGHFFGNIPTVRENFSLVIMAIVVISIMRGIIEYLRHRGKAA